MARGSDGTWESAVAQVVLAGRVDGIEQMWKPWKKIVDHGGELDYLKGQLNSLAESLTEHWQGDAATMFQQKIESMLTLIQSVRDHYATMRTCLNLSRSALIDAKKKIPVPIFGGEYINGAAVATPDGRYDSGKLYQDFQKSGDGKNNYRDFWRAAVDYLERNAVSDEKGLLRSDGWQSSSGARDVTMSPPEADANEKAKIRQEAEQAAEKWYYSNSPKANDALNGQNGLRSEYLQHLSRLPSPVLGSKYHRHDDDGRNGNGNGAGAGAGTGSGGAGLPVALGASHVPRAPDWSSAGGVPGSGEPTSPLDKPSDMLGTEPGSDSSGLRDVS